ncbi:hypothetical protein DID88_004642 [Monilinia fructigena]|uniref:CoA carboxyltransferase C-terminal domain-containing protein n=1 Tax=Monilinia fructigena TaxID=38457 RepID=A0A395IR76_9HELO|nr:hypothetical protein DID88_004642 [Monilinia fructigena]
MTNPNHEKSSSKIASDRISQVTGHISNTPKKRRVAKSKNDLPADYSDVLGTISSLQTIAKTPDLTNKGYIHQKQAGKLWVRERVLQLLDKDSFREVGSVSGTVEWRKLEPSQNSGKKEEPVSYVPSNNVQGFGLLRGRKVLFTADDFSIRAGHADGALAEKTIYMEKLAVALRLPIIKLVDGSSGGGSVTTIQKEGYSYIPLMPSFNHVVQQLNMGIPNLGAVLGPAIGLGAARVVSCHFSVMAADVGALFNAGPKVVAGATFEEGLSFKDLGGPESWFEIGALWGTTAIIGLARLAGRPVGIISLNCEINAGALDAAGSQKITRHLKFCDIFNIPILQFVDVPGYAIGTIAERTATMRHGVGLGTTYYSTTTPIFNVVTRKVYGVAGGIMLDCRDPRFRVAWPSGEWGSLPLDGGIEVGHAAELKAAEANGKREERYRELEEEYTRLMNPVRTANAFGVEEIIDPAATRQIVCEWLKHVYEELLPIRLLDRGNGKIHPMFC